MFCKNCGNEMSDQAKFCPRCGAPVNGVVSSKGKKVTSKQKKKGKKKSGILGRILKRLFIILIILCLLTAIGVGLWFSRNKILTLVGLDEFVPKMSEEAVYEEKEDEEESKEETEEEATVVEKESEQGAYLATTAPAIESKSDISPKVLRDQYIWMDISTIRASSTLSADSYSAANLMDDDTTTAWIEGKDGIGVGEYVTFCITPGTLVYGFYVIPGYTKSEDLFQKNGVPTKISVSDGTLTEEIDISGFVPDFSDPRKSALYIDLDKPMGALGSNITVTMLEIRPGSKYTDSGFTELWPYSYVTEESTTVSETTAPESYNRAVISERMNSWVAAETTVAAVKQAEYMLFDSDKRILTMDDLAGFTASDCKIARNEIYARHGRKFKDSLLQAYFDACSWYTGTIESSAFKEDTLSEIEKANRDLIKQYEEAHGYNK